MNRRAAATAMSHWGARRATGRASRQRRNTETAGTGRKGPRNSNIRMKSLGHRGPGNLGSWRSRGRKLNKHSPEASPRETTTRTRQTMCGQCEDNREHTTRAERPDIGKRISGPAKERCQKNLHGNHKRETFQKRDPQGCAILVDGSAYNSLEQGEEDNMRRPQGRVSRYQETATRETEPTGHVSKTGEAQAARKTAEPGCKRGQLRPQEPSKASAVIVATKTLSGTWQQPATRRLLECTLQRGPKSAGDGIRLRRGQKYRRDVRKPE